MSPPARSLAVALALVVVVLLAPPGTSASFDGITRTRWSSGFGSRTFEARGSIEFTDDDRDVKAISPGGYILIEEGSWLRTERSYKIWTDSGGSLSRTYRVGGRAKTMDADAQAWVAGVMLTLIRESGVSAGLRIERLLRKGEPTAVLREVSEIHSDGSKRIYLRELVGRGRLNDEQLRDVMRSARTIGSDGDKTGLLIEVSRSYLRVDLREPWFTVLRGVGSDGDKRRGLEHAIKSDPVAETLALTARVASGIGSDGDKAAVLSAIAAGGLTDAVRQLWFRAVRTIGSDGDKRRVLVTVLAVLGDDRDTLIEVLRAAETIGSDGDKAAVLSRVAEFEMNDLTTRAAFFTVANTIGSDGDRTAVLSSLLRKSELASETVMAAIDSATAMGSDGNKASVLLLAAERHASSPAVRAALEKALRSVHSEGDYRRVSTALLRPTI